MKRWMILLVGVLAVGGACRRGERRTTADPEELAALPERGPPMYPESPKWLPKGTKVVGDDVKGEAMVAAMEDICRKFQQPEVTVDEMVAYVGTVTGEQKGVAVEVQPRNPLFKEAMVERSGMNPNLASAVSLTPADEKALSTVLLKRHFGMPTVGRSYGIFGPYGFGFPRHRPDPRLPVGCKLVVTSWLNPEDEREAQKKAERLMKERGLGLKAMTQLRGELLDGLVLYFELQREGHRYDKLRAAGTRDRTAAQPPR